MMSMTRTEESTAGGNVFAPTLLLAFELGERTWKLGFSTGLGQRPRLRQIPAGATARLLDEIAGAKVRFGLPADAAVVSCYEVGREAFWLHRWLVAHAVANHVIDSSSIEVNRRARRAKTDRLDLGGLLNLLARYQLGDRRVWRTVRVPSREEEDARPLHRTRETLQQDRNRLINRLKGLMTTQGLALPVGADFLMQLDTVRLWDGTPIPAGLKARLQRVWGQLASLNTALEELDAERATHALDPQTTMGRYVTALPTLRGIGPVGTWTLTTELFGWRQIANRRQLGALVGLVPAPYQSGESAHDQGITRAGNAHVRRVMVQLAWSWVRYQPDTCAPQIYRRARASRSRDAARQAIFMVQTAEDRRGDHLHVFWKAMTAGRELIRVGHRLRNARPQTGVWTTSIVVGHPLTKGSPEVGLVHRDQPIETLSTYGDISRSQNAFACGVRAGVFSTCRPIELIA